MERSEIRELHPAQAVRVGGGLRSSVLSAPSLPGCTHLRHAPLWISAVHIGHWAPFRCCAAAGWPLATSAQQHERMRRLGVIPPLRRRRSGIVGPQ